MEHIRNLMTRGLTRRTFLAGLGATAALPILAACAPSVEKEIVEVTRIVEKVVEVEKLVVPGVVDLPNFPGDPTIRYVTWSVDGDKAYNDIIYEKTGVVCNVEPLEGGAEKLLTQVAAGVGPDVLFPGRILAGRTSSARVLPRTSSRTSGPTTSPARDSATIHGSKTVTTVP